MLEFWKHYYLNSYNISNFIRTPWKSRDFKPEVWKLKYLSVTSYLKSGKTKQGDSRKQQVFKLFLVKVFSQFFFS